jgi:hypothetical protein
MSDFLIKSSFPYQKFFLYFLFTYHFLDLLQRSRNDDFFLDKSRFYRKVHYYVMSLINN